MTVEEYMRQVKDLLENEFAAHNIYTHLSIDSDNAQICFGSLGDICLVIITAGSYDNGDKFARVSAGYHGVVYCKQEHFDSWPTMEELKDSIYACADFIQAVS